MTHPALLVLRYNSGTPQALRLVSDGEGGMTAVNVNAAFGSSEANTQASGNSPNNRIVQWGNDLYCWQRNEIYKSVGGTGTWTSVHTTASQNAGHGYGRHTGLHHALDSNNNPILTGLCANTNGTEFYYVKFDGTTWTSATVESQTVGTIGRGFMWQNKLYLSWAIGAKVIQYSPDTNLAVLFDLSARGNQHCREFCAFDGRLFSIEYNATAVNSSASIYELIAGTWTQRSNGTNTSVGSEGGTAIASNSTEYFQSGPVMFTDGVDLFLIVVGKEGSGGSIGSHCYRLVKNGLEFTETKLTSTVLPSIYQPGGGSAAITNRWFVLYDNDTDPDSPTIYLGVYGVENGGTFSIYKWNGFGSAMTLEGGGISSTGMALPSFQQGGGDSWWTSGELNVHITDKDSVLGGMKISFKAYGDPGGGAAKTVKLYYADDDVPEDQCTLVGTATGGSASRNGNQIDSVTADDGSTTYTVIWDFNIDGFSAGGRATLMPHIVA